MSFTNPTFPDVDPDTFLRKPLNFDKPSRHAEVLSI
jgi:hypothetical protein